MAVTPRLKTKPPHKPLYSTQGFTQTWVCVYGIDATDTPATSGVDLQEGDYLPENPLATAAGTSYPVIPADTYVITGAIEIGGAGGAQQGCGEKLFRVTAEYDKRWASSGHSAGVADELYMSRPTEIDSRSLEVTMIFQGLVTDSFPTNGNLITAWDHFETYSGHGSTFREPRLLHSTDIPHQKVGIRRMKAVFRGSRKWP